MNKRPPSKTRLTWAIKNVLIMLAVKAFHSIKVVSFILLIIFTLQIADLVCIGEGTAKETQRVQDGYQIKAADLDNGSEAPSSSTIPDHCHCPCHLKFSSPSLIVAFYQAIGLPLIQTVDSAFPETSHDIFIPPKALI